MEYLLDFTEKAYADIDFHKKSGNKAILSKLFTFLEELTQHPFSGSGKPESLKHNLSGMWSRRINRQHRIYEVEQNTVFILSVKGHYE